MHLDVGGIPPKELADLIAAGAAPALIDVCIDEDFACDPSLVPGATRQRHRDIQSNRDTVVICQKGLKLSMGAAALLRAKGINATHLIGGNVAWQALGLPRLGVTALPRSKLWVTAREPVACDVLRFLITRFLGKGADLLAIESSACDAVAERFDAAIAASPEDWLRRVGLDTPALSALAREADDEGSSLRRLICAARTLPNAEETAGAILSAAYAAHRSAGTL